MVTDQQVMRYRKKLRTGKTREAAAAAAGMTAKTARKWEDGSLPSMSKLDREWRTRQDPLEKAWSEHVLPLLGAEGGAKLQATTILDELKKKPDVGVSDGHLRTLQRRLRDWRAVQGPPKEVYFEQVHVPGREAQVDFTHGEELQVTIADVPLAHLLLELILSYSKHRFVGLYYGETYEALVEGCQDGFWDFGGSVKVLRSDNLSAATYELREGGRKATKRFQDFLDHFGLDYTRIQPGKSNENGVVEKAHDVLKTALEQALILRASRDFATLDEYQAFVQGVVRRLNMRVDKQFEEECLDLRPLPSTRFPTHTDIRVSVRKWSTIRVGNNTYSVPSRLIGREVTARVHPSTVEIIYNGKVLECYPRLRGQGQHRIDYHHIIHSLVTKPGAFARYRFREELFPTLTFRRAYDALRARRGERADIEYVRILHLAATTLESEVETALQLLLEAGDSFEYGDVKSLVDIAPRPVMDHLRPFVPDLYHFDRLLTGGCHVRDERQEQALIAC
jgi:hypothetical protein